MSLGLFRFNPVMPLIDLIEHIQRLPDRCPDRVASIDELSVVTDVLIEVFKQFLGDLNADLRHTLVFVEEYLQRVAQYIRLAPRSLLLHGRALAWVVWACGNTQQRPPFDLGAVSTGCGISRLQVQK